MKKKYIYTFLTLFLILNLFSQQKSNWPKDIKVNKDLTISLYSPENSSYLDNKLQSSMAFSIKKIEEAPVFGMLWLTTLLDVDRQTRMASLVSTKIDEVRFSEEVSDVQKKKFEDLINSEIPKWNIEFSIDELISSLEEVTADQSQIKNDVPKFIFVKEPTVLILIDGEPVFKEVENGYQAIVNSSAFIIKENSSNTYFLKGGSTWYSSKNSMTNWSVIKKVPSKIKKIAKQAQSKDNEFTNDDDDFDLKNPPKLLISNEIVELIVFDGEPDYAPIQNTKLLYIKNSENDLFLDIGEQKYYILISGRWFSSKDLNGNWNYIDPEKLPSDFSAISNTDEKANVLSSVAGTPEAKNAVYDAQLPQTAKVSRDTKATTVVYDGTAEFAKINDLELEYAVNTESDVFKSKNEYYLCDNAVWFKSNSPNGPWRVADERPLEVDKIPADNPKYNTKYVYIYETSPTEVYIGYTPGYYGSYINGPTMVYGTGYYYNPWYRGRYYHHQFTYGFSFRYNPWYGWSVGFRFGSPYSWFGYSFWGPGFHHWGPSFYRPPYYRRGYYGYPSRPLYGHRPGIDYYNRPNRPGYRPNRPNRPNRPEGVRPTNPNTRPVTRPSSPSTQPSTRPVTRPTTPNTQPSTRPVTRPSSPSTQPSTRPITRPSNPSTFPSTRPIYRPTSPNVRPVTRPSARPVNRPVARPSMQSRSR